MPEPAKFKPAPDRPSTLPMDAQLVVLADAVERIGPARVRHSGRNAFNHLRKSWELHPVDAEMSYFRALTAEEEAASALILALRQQRYPGAKRLDPQIHAHKAAVWVILEAIVRGYTDKKMPRPQISIGKEGRPRIRIDVDIGPMIDSDGPYWVHSPDPFHTVIHSDEKGPFELHRWAKELAQIAGPNKSIMRYVRELANNRNRVLYANEKGVPSIIFPDELILERLERVKWIMVVVIGVLQTKTLQLLVIQALEALLIAVERFEGEGFAFPQFDQSAANLSIEQQPDGSFVSGFKA
ncbi:hypothetical protein [Sphingopyxis sp. FD7]|jgi:hypothetical protein|uniref:hypothetical protein n=1 Tax=Sphingopyxis sp. FD7 TaxID=1914525 RepID=UPI0010F948F5|nr:hypothetical protein [Sphingopyxis sp. FD7]